MSRVLRWRRGFVLGVVIAIATPAWHAVACAQSPADSATIIVSLLERPVGNERYTVQPNGAGYRLTSSLDLVERGTPLTLSSTLDLAGDLTPTSYRAKGKSYRFVDVDAAVEIAGGIAHVRYLAQREQVALSGPFFTTTGWPPLAGRALLIGYWETHGRPSAIRLLPGPATHVARIAFRGVDTVSAGGRPVVLRRFVVDGVVWGGETVWLDAGNRFAAIATRIHILPLEGVRADLIGAVPELQRRAVADRMSALRTMSRDVAPLATDIFAIVGATVIDGSGGAPIVDATVVVRNGRLEAIGSRTTVTVPAGARVIDGRGKTVIPGLWDMHAHASQVEWAPAYLAAGVTTIRDMGGEEPFLIAFRQAIATGGGLGPRLLIAGLVDGDAADGFGIVTAATPAAGRAVVDHLRAIRADQVKLYSLLQPDVVRAIVARAHAVGLTVTGHVPRALGIRGSIAAGMDQVAHLPVTGSEDSGEVRAIVDLLARRRVVIDPTLPWNELLGRSPDTPIERFEPGIRSAPPALAMNYRSVITAADSAKAAASLRAQLALVKSMHDAGVPLVAGTDGALPGYSLLRSIELLVQAGLTPMEALRSATSGAADAMGLAHEVGTLAVGRRADLVVLDADPLRDIANIRTTRWVVANGRLYESAALWRAAGFGR